MTRRPWYLYVVECRGGTFYTGITTEVARRVHQHNAGHGARYTSSRRPVRLLAAWRFPNRRSAMLAETAFKCQGRGTKRRRIESRGDYREGIWVKEPDTA